MTNDIKQRIEQINRGEVPQGYKKTEVGIVPNEWESEDTFGDLFDFYGGLGIPRDRLSENGVPYLHYGDMHKEYFTKASYEKYNHLPKYDTKLKGDETYLIQDGDMAFLDASEDLAGTSRCVVIDNPENLPFISGLHTFVAKPKKQALYKEYKQYLTAPQMVQRQFEKLASGFKVYGLNRNTVKQISIAYPRELNEQKNIAKILSKWDEAIELQEKLVEKLEEQKKAFMQKLLTPKKGWGKYKINHFMKIKDIRQTPSDLAPLFAFVANIGISDKGEKYDRSALVKNKNKMYKRTDLNDFIYSSNNLDVGSIGLNQYGTVVISDVYEIFEINSNAIPIVISQIIQSPEILYKILQFRQGALYGQYRIHAKNFLSVEISMPTIEEQSDIACILSTSERQLSLMGEKLQKLKQQQKALQQLLLTGIVRV